MQKKRPVAVTVLAIFHLIIGGGGLVLLLALTCFGLAIYFLISAAPRADKEKMGEMFATLPDHVPGVVPFLIFSAVYVFIVYVVLLVAGLGLLKMRRWARTASIVYAVAGICILAVNTPYNVLYLAPGIEKWQNEMLAKQGNANIQQVKQDPVTQAVSTVFGVLIGLAYPVAVLIVLFRPKVVAAFAGQGDNSCPIDDEDDPYERGWRSSEDQPPEG